MHSLFLHTCCYGAIPSLFLFSPCYHICFIIGNRKNIFYDPIPLYSLSTSGTLSTYQSQSFQITSLFPLHFLIWDSVSFTHPFATLTIMFTSPPHTHTHLYLTTATISFCFYFLLPLHISPVALCSHPHHILCPPFLSLAPTACSVSLSTIGSHFLYPLFPIPPFAPTASSVLNSTIFSHCILCSSIHN